MLKIERTVSGDLNDKLEALDLCFADGLPYFSDFGISLDYDADEHAAAKARLIAAGKDAYRENIWTEIVRGGGTLRFEGGEGQEDEVFPLNIGILEANWGKVPQHNLINLVEENYDANDSDCIVQALIFGEVRFG